MSLFSDKLSPMLNFRMHWLSARTNILTGNITMSDVKGLTRREMLPFHELLRRQQLSSNGKHNPDTLKIRSDDFIKTNTEISKELEILELSRNTMEHDAIVTTLKNFHQIVKMVINSNQAG
jgi:flagellar basal body rod protein FlgB